MLEVVGFTEQVVALANMMMANNTMTPITIEKIPRRFTIQTIDLLEDYKLTDIQCI